MGQGDDEGLGDYACTLERGAKGEVTGSCRVAGEGEAGQPCDSSAACAAGLACVGEANAGQCRPLCCGDPEACDEGTFCTERPLVEPRSADGSELPLLMVPVCSQPDSCLLDEAQGCSKEGQNTCQCQDGLACTLVRDQMTSCVSPGQGQAGDPCPCAPTTPAGLGFVCSPLTNTCLKLCTRNEESGCGGGYCQYNASLPEAQFKYGTCTVGTVEDAGH